MAALPAVVAVGRADPLRAHAPYTHLTCCGFPRLVLDGLPPSFPHLKRLFLFEVGISDDYLQSMISNCHFLQTVWLQACRFGRLCSSSPTLRSISVEGVFTFRELVIVDAPCLERLLPIYPNGGPATIRVIRAPKLEVLGFLSQGIPRLHLGTTVFQVLARTVAQSDFFICSLLYYSDITHSVSFSPENDCCHHDNQNARTQDFGPRMCS